MPSTSLEKLTGIAAIKERAETAMDLVLAKPTIPNSWIFDDAAEKYQLALHAIDLRAKLVKGWQS